MTRTFPLMIIARDRLTTLRKMLDHLERVDRFDITIIDNDSAYPPLLEFYETTNHKVIRLNENHGQLVPWKLDLVPRDTPYLVSDPDVIPVEDCPLDYPDIFYEMLIKFDLLKVGFSLKVDDLPDHYKPAEIVRSWEGMFWNGKRRYKNVYYYTAPIDTTLAMYKPNSTHDFVPAIRTAPPYTARHLAWYIDSENPSDEDVFYKDRANLSIASWGYDKPNDKGYIEHHERHK